MIISRAAVPDLQPIRGAPIAVGVDRFLAFADFSHVGRIDGLLERLDQLVVVLRFGQVRFNGLDQLPRLVGHVLALGGLLREAVGRRLGEHLGHEPGRALPLRLIARRVEDRPRPAEPGALARELVSQVRPSQR